MRAKFVWDIDARPPEAHLVETEYLVYADLVLNHPGLSHPSKLDHHEIKLHLNAPSPSVIVTGRDDADTYHLRYVDEGC